MTTGERTGTLGAMAGVLVLFLFGRFFGPGLFFNNWSFTHWQYLPWYYGPLWIVSLAIACVAAYRYADRMARWFVRRRVRWAAGIALLVIFWLMRFDSFVFGGANAQIGAISHAERLGGVVIYRWFAFGVTLVADQFHTVLTSLGVEITRAGVLVWQVFAFAATALSIPAAWRVSSALSVDYSRRVWLFALVFFGPQTLLYFGYIGHGPIIVAFSLWVGARALEAMVSTDRRTLVLMWLTLAIAVVFHVSLAYLLPAAVYVSLHVLSNGRRQFVWISVGIGTLGLLVAALYVYAGRSLEAAAQILMIDSKKPLSDYGAFSLRHIGDFAQVLFLSAPLVIVFKWMAVRRVREFFLSPVAVTGWLMAAGGTVLVFTLDPVNSIPLDLPRFVAYLGGIGIAIAALAGGTFAHSVTTRTLAALAAASILLPISYLPIYTSLARAEHYVEPYVESRRTYYQPAAIAFRDTHFYRRAFDAATGWEQRLSTQSESFMHLQGCLYLAAGGRGDEAIPRLYQLIAGHPYWWEPRAALARTQLSLGRPDLAGPQIDTALMLEPFNREPLVLQYEYYRNLGRVDSALYALEFARDYFPADTFIATDHMLLRLRAGEYAVADSLAEDRLSRDSAHAHAWYVKGVLADRAGKVTPAINYYNRFLEIGPADPDTVRVRRRMETLKMALEQ